MRTHVSTRARPQGDVDVASAEHGMQRMTLSSKLGSAPSGAAASCVAAQASRPSATLNDQAPPMPLSPPLPLPSDTPAGNCIV